MNDVTLLQGNNLPILRTLPSGSVHCCVTSIPYLGLRDYGTARWDGGDPDCPHQPSATPATRGLASSTLGGGKATTGHQQEGYRNVCPRCGARRVDEQLGLEDTPEQYVANLVAVFAEVRRVLRDDSTLWLNAGVSYNGSGGAGGDYAVGGSKAGQPKFPGRDFGGWKAKDLMLTPFMVAEALRQDGWYLRSAIPWLKAASMPESATDRPTSAIEWVFLLSKSARYYYDSDAVRMPMLRGTAGSTFTDGKTGVNGRGRVSKNARQDNPLGRARRNSDWWRESLKSAIAYHMDAAAQLQRLLRDGGMLDDENGDPLSVYTMPDPFPEAHFATFVPSLIAPMIRASTSLQNCPHCEAPWRRVVERGGDRSAPWPTCSCDLNDGSGRAVVLDPFSGSGTTGLVARQLGRRYIGIELNPQYLKMSRKRIGSQDALPI